MIDYDMSNEFSNFIADSNKFFKEFNRCYPVDLEIENKDRVGLCIAFFLSKICDSLQVIEIREAETCE